MMDRKGMVSLPLKLSISFLIIALMVPPILVVADNIHESMDEGDIRAEAELLSETVSKLGMKNLGSTIVIKMSIPKSGHMCIGGDDGRIVRLYHDDDLIGRVILSTPIVNDEVLISGSVILELENTEFGVEVHEL